MQAFHGMIKEPLSVVLRGKHKRVYKVEPAAPVEEAVEMMSEHRIGSVLVEDARGRIVGILTEREVVIGIVYRQRDPASTPVMDLMLKDPPVVSPNTSVEEAMSIMTERRLRQLPVAHEGELIGLVSIGDLTKWMLEENHQLVDFITGRYPG